VLPFVCGEGASAPVRWVFFLGDDSEFEGPPEALVADGLGVDGDVVAGLGVAADDASEWEGVLGGRGHCSCWTIMMVY